MKKWIVANLEKREKLISLIGYLLVGGFFLTLYLMMTMNFEDMYQQNSHVGDNLIDIFVKIFNYIPRIGEFYQRTAIHFMTQQVSFGPDMLFRIMTAVFSFSAIYLSTMLVLKRRPKLKYKDSLVFLGFFLLLMLSYFRQATMYSFAYIHNYMIAIVLMLLFVMPFWLKLKTGRPEKLLMWAAIGFLFGIANEVAPIAAIIMLGGLMGWQRRKKLLSWKKLWQNEKLIIFMVAGMLAGLGFFYAGAGLSVRTQGGYAKVYEYTSATKIIKEPIKTAVNLSRNFVYNFRKLGPTIAIVGLIILSELARKNRNREDKERMKFHIGVIGFSLLYLGAVSQIKIHDDLYWRFLLPYYWGVMLIIMTYANSLIREIRDIRQIGTITIMMTGLAMIVTADMVFGIIRYHRAVKVDLDKVYRDESGELVINHERLKLKGGMTPSPLFRFRQTSIFEF